MIYPGDTYPIILSITAPYGATPTVTVSPLITIINLSTTSPVISSQAMTLLSGTNLLYYYNFNTTSLSTGMYIAVASFAYNGNTYNNFFIESIKLGDTNITGPVALNSTVAKDATVAKDLTVAHLTDLATINPNTSSVVLAIQTKVNTLPTSPADNSLLTTVANLATDTRDAVIGSWIINKTANPNTLTYLRTDGVTTLSSYNVSEDSSSALKTKVTYVPA